MNTESLTPIETIRQCSWKEAAETQMLMILLQKLCRISSLVLYPGRGDEDGRGYGDGDGGGKVDTNPSKVLEVVAESSGQRAVHPTEEP